MWVRHWGRPSLSSLLPLKECWFPGEFEQHPSFSGFTHFNETSILFRLYNFTSEGLLDRLAQWTFMCGDKGSWKMSQFLGQQHEYQNQLNSSDRTFSSENVACLRMSFSALGVLVGRYASETGVDSSKKRLKLICRSSLMALAALARTFLSNQFFPIHRDFWHSDTWFERIWFRTLIEFCLMVLITIYWEYIFAPIQILGKVIVLLLCFGEEGQTGKILSETVW